MPKDSALNRKYFGNVPGWAILAGGAAVAYLWFTKPGSKGPSATVAPCPPGTADDGSGACVESGTLYPPVQGGAGGGESSSDVAAAISEGFANLWEQIQAWLPGAGGGNGTVPPPDDGGGTLPPPPEGGNGTLPPPAPAPTLDCGDTTPCWNWSTDIPGIPIGSVPCFGIGGGQYVGPADARWPAMYAQCVGGGDGGPAPVREGLKTGTDPYVNSYGSMQDGSYVKPSTTQGTIPGGTPGPTPYTTPSPGLVG